MEKWKLAGLILAGALAALTVFHAVHYALFCRYKGVPGKSHCSVCGHRRICQKRHAAAKKMDAGGGRP